MPCHCIHQQTSCFSLSPSAQLPVRRGYHDCKANTVCVSEYPGFCSCVELPGRPSARDHLALYSVLKAKASVSLYGRSHNSKKYNPRALNAETLDSWSCNIHHQLVCIRWSSHKCCHAVKVDSIHMHTPVSRCGSCICYVPVCRSASVEHQCPDQMQVRVNLNSSPSRQTSSQMVPADSKVLRRSLKLSMIEC